MAKRQRYAKTADGSIYLNPLDPKNAAQEHYMNMMRETTITFATGPAGTAKTYLATYIALEALLVHRSVSRIMLTRPIVAVEDIGYLPGDMQEKIHPYVLPLLDAIEDHVGVTKAKELVDNGLIHIVPLAYMRGRSLNDAFIVLDEAQNTTKEQMKMFLTRLGYESKMVITGDVTQNDLPKHLESGLAWAVDRLRGVEKEIGLVEFYHKEIVRNPLIAKMLAHLDGGKVPVSEKEERRENTIRRFMNAAGGSLLGK